MTTVLLKPLLHGGRECIGIYFEMNFKIQEALKKNGLAKFSSTHKCWYVPLSRENYNKVFFALEGLATLENSALYQYLADKKNKNDGTVSLALTTKPVVPLPAPANPLVKAVQLTPSFKGRRIHEVNAHVLPLMKERLQLKAYSPSTLRTYLNEMSQLLQTIGHIPADELKPEHLRRYLVYCFEKFTPLD